MEFNNTTLVADATNIEKITFYKKVYTHLAIAILGFILVETILINVVPVEWIAFMLGGKLVWLFILGLFWLGSTLSNSLAFHPSKDKQYLGLAAYILLESIIFLPILYVLIVFSESSNVLMQAVLLTLFLFGGLTATVFLTNKDFSFLRTFITIGGFVSLGVIVCGAIFGFDLGLWFSTAMIIIAGAGILYQTQQIKDQFSADQYVGASLQLFASIMLLFWYVLRLLSRRN